MIGKREMQKITITEKLIRNENEAIEAIKANMPTSGYQMLRESLDMAIQALEEIQQYREIGTVEECREAREKQKPKKIIRIVGRYPYKCPTCNGKLEIGYRHCIICGQLLRYPYENLEEMEDE